MRRHPIARDRAPEKRWHPAALVDLAADLFAEQGYLQSSIRDVARRGSVTTGAIYGHFRNKADLLVEAINTRTAVELEAQSIGLSKESDHIEILTRQAKAFPKRRALRALIVQGAAAAHTDPERGTSSARSNSRTSTRGSRAMSGITKGSASTHTWTCKLRSFSAGP